MTADLVMTRADLNEDEALKIVPDRLDQGDDPDTSGDKYDKGLVCDVP